MEDNLSFFPHVNLICNLNYSVDIPLHNITNFYSKKMKIIDNDKC